MKKIIFGMSALIMSFSSIAGGGGSWSPSISPEHCVGVSYNPFSVFWTGMKQCQEAIDHGYAQGVGFSGVVSYGNGNESSNMRAFSGVVHPGERLTSKQLGVPETIGNAKINGTGKIAAFWVQ
ncbi:TPA: hypothetical protein ACNB0W_004647 [Escherichia coli]|uniref:Uncharacterized protein n=1 Tax=Escherichia coli TaxID=562 RepID=A0A6M9X339_ECOLX|nr:hypothetical protein [Escherichia coli]EFP6909754.1 hypothetical protein [Shigella dysenteriae]EFX6130290.1 hypothetical protein [Shigella boydii]HCS1426211.1 hypothetical protein [Shigella sonnei]EEQ1708189.1 hypothetical protein [Escherichia coli]EEQ1742636.1 hypothetical protein [Escherichia coli]